VLPGGCQFKEKTLTCLIQTGESFSLNSNLGLLCLLQTGVGRFLCCKPGVGSGSGLSWDRTQARRWRPRGISAQCAARVSLHRCGLVPPSHENPLGPIRYSRQWRRASSYFLSSDSKQTLGSQGPVDIAHRCTHTRRKRALVKF